MFNRFLFLITVLALSITSCNREKGCMDIYACNFSVTAEKDDGSCVFVGDECDDSDPTTVNDVLQSDCSCSGEFDVSSLIGCMDEAACNFNPNAQEENGSCYYVGDPCDDGNSNTADDTINGNCDCVGSSGTDVQGCMDSGACNYNPSATLSNGSCYYVGDPCNDNNSSTYDDAYNSNCICEGVSAVYGCMNSSACNYDPNANMDLPATCVFIGDACDDGNSQTENDEINSNCDCEGTPASSGSCEFDVDGYTTLTIGVYADSYEEECVYELFVTADPTITTGELVPTIENSLNESVYNVLAGNWTMQVTDSYGDGKGSNGYYYAKCAAIGGGELILFETPFTTGYESSTEFTVY